MYANLTDDQRQSIIQEFDRAIGNTDPKHASAIAAVNGLRIGNKAWNGKKGSNAWAAALAVLVMAGKLEVKAAA